jgi:hypothetical protein
MTNMPLLIFFVAVLRNKPEKHSPLPIAHRALLVLKFAPVSAARPFATGLFLLIRGNTKVAVPSPLELAGIEPAARAGGD